MVQRRTVRLLALVALLFAVLAMCATAVEPAAGEQAGSGNRVAFRMHDDAEDEDGEDADTGVNTAGAAETEDDEDAPAPQAEKEEQEEVQQQKQKETHKKPATRRRARNVHADDDDEFEGTEEVRKQQKRGPQKIALGELRRRQQMAEAAAAGQQQGAQQQQQDAQKPRDWRMEIAMGSVAAVYLLWFAVGAVVNTRLARRWLRNSRTFLDEQFAQLGDPYRGVKDLERESFSQFYLQATGRINCIGARFSIDVCFPIPFFFDTSFIAVAVVATFWNKTDVVFTCMNEHYHN